MNVEYYSYSSQEFMRHQSGTTGGKFIFGTGLHGHNTYVGWIGFLLLSKCQLIFRD